MRSVLQKVRGYGEMEFLVRYENIPDFCFGCGRIGHDEDECPDEGPVGGGVHFGKALRCSPQKKDAGKRITIPADDLGAKRGMNFSGDQQQRAMSAASSSAGQKRKSTQNQNIRRFREEEHAASVTFGAHIGIPVEVSEELVAGVKWMGMDQVLPDLNDQVPPFSPERVSGINSFVESSGGTESASASHLSMRDRLLFAKNSKEGVAGERKSHMDVKVTTKEIEKPKRSKKVTHAHITEAIKELEKNGLDSVNKQLKQEDKETEAQDSAAFVKEGESPAKRSRQSTPQATPLTGARAEPRQEQ